MAVEHVFAPKDKPLGNLPLPTSVGTGPTILGAEWSQWKRGDQPMILGRNRIVADGSWKVLETELRDTDRGGYSPNSCRNEFWRGDNAEQGIYLPGETMCCEFGFNLPVGFPTPPTWSSVFQIHTPYDSPSTYWYPMVVFDVSMPGKIRIQNNSEGGVDATLDIAYGRFDYYRMLVTFGRPGVLKVWRAIDRRPSDSERVVDNTNRNTMPPNPSGKTGSYTKNGTYVAVASGGRVYTHRRDAYAEAASLARVDALFTPVCRPEANGGTPPPPPPSNRELVAAAKAELEQTTISGKKWVAAGRGAGHWRNAYAILDRITD